MPLPRVPLDSNNEKQHRTVIATTVNELVKTRPPFDRTAAEVAAGVTPLDYGYERMNILRQIPQSEHAAIFDGTTTYDASDDIERVNSAYGLVYVPGGLTLYGGTSSLAVKQLIGGYPRPTLKGTVTGSSSLCRVSNIKFQPDGVTTSAARNTAISYNVSGGALDIQDCEFDGMAVLVAAGGQLETVRVEGCEFYGTCQHDETNAVAVAASRSVIISNNVFRGQFYRDVKLTNAPGSATDVLETAFANNNVTIIGNQFKGSRFLDGLGVGKQAIDAFSCARKLVVVGNEFSLSNKVEVWFDFKDGGLTSSTVSTLQQEVVFANNVCKGECERGIRCQGARGQTYAGDRQKIVVTGNVIETTNDDYASVIELQYLHDVDVSSNIVIGDNALQTFIFTGNRRLNFHDNQGNGCLFIEEGSRTEPHDADFISVVNNQLVVDSTTNYPANFAAIQPSSSGANIIVADNSFQYVGGTRNIFRFNTLAGWDNLICTGNATSDNTRSLQFDTSSPDNIVVENNSWQNVPQTLTGAGAVDIIANVTLLVTTGANALTLADGREGQKKRIVMKTDGGNGTLTPTNLYNGTTLTFDDVGDSADLLFTDGQWVFLGGTATLA